MILFQLNHISHHQKGNFLCREPRDYWDSALLGRWMKACSTYPWGLAPLLGGPSFLHPSIKMTSAAPLPCCLPPPHLRGGVDSSSFITTSASWFLICFLTLSCWGREPWTPWDGEVGPNRFSDEVWSKKRQYSMTKSTSLVNDWMTLPSAESDHGWFIRVCVVFLFWGNISSRSESQVLHITVHL